MSWTKVECVYLARPVHTLLKLESGKDQPTLYWNERAKRRKNKLSGSKRSYYLAIGTKDLGMIALSALAMQDLCAIGLSKGMPDSQAQVQIAE